MKKVLVIGAAGVLGRMVCQELIRIWQDDIHLTVSDYRTERGRHLAETLNANYCNVDMENRRSIQKAVQRVDCVVVVLKQQEAIIQEICIEYGVDCIDVTPFSGFISRVEALHELAREKGVCSIVMSGFFPGLSGLMIKNAVKDFDEISQVNVGLLQNTNAQAGTTGIVDMLQIISQRVSGNEQGSYPGFSKKRKLHFGRSFMKRSVRAIHHDEKGYIISRLGIRNVNYWTAWNQAIFNIFVSFTIRVGLIKHIINMKKPHVLSKFVKHNRMKEEVAYLSIEVTGESEGETRKKVYTLTTPSDYQVTAMVTASLIAVIDSGNSGVVFPFELTDVDTILKLMQSDKLTLKIHTNEKIL